jgi:hypothetical protein
MARVSETLSRSELLKARGYVESPNGTAPAESSPTTAPPQRRRTTRKRTRRWPPGRSCDRCGAPLSEYQSRFCSNACRYADRPVAGSSAAISAPQIEPEPLAFLAALPSFVTALEVEGWRLTRT